MFSKQKIDHLLNQPMSRRDFLRNIGVLLISIIGLSSALNILATGQSHGRLAGTGEGLHDFGDGRFGG